MNLRSLFPALLLSASLSFSAQAQTTDLRVKPDGTFVNGPIDIDPGQLTIGGVAASAISDGDKGDVTVSSSGSVITINDGAVAFSELSGKPTTLSGYGVTDAAPSVLVKHKDGTSSRYQPSTNTDAARGTALLTAVATLVDGDELQMGATTYDIGTSVVTVPDGNISIRGAGKYSTLIDCSSSNGRAAFKPGTDTYAADFAVRGVNAPLGFISLIGQSVAVRSTFERIRALGSPAVDGWLLVNQSTSYSMTLIDCEAQTTYDCIATSGGPGTATITLIRPDFSAISPNSNLARSIVAGNTTTLEIRGGSLYAATGSGAGSASVVSLGSGAVISMHGVKSRVVGSGMVDVISNGGNVTVYGGSGSGTNGDFVTNGAVNIQAFPIATSALQSVRRNSADTAFEAFTPLGSADIDTSAELAAILTNETGTGAAVFATSPTFVTPILGAATATSVTAASNTSDSSLKVGTLELQDYGLNNAWIGENIYYDGTNFKYRATGSGTLFYFFGSEGQLRSFPSAAAGTTAGSGTNVRLKVNETGVFGIGGSMPLTPGDTSNATFKGDTSGNVTAVGVMNAKASRSTAVAFASAVSSPSEGTTQAFTDSTTATWGATITGGGSNHVLGYFNGTNWTVAGK